MALTEGQKKILEKQQSVNKGQPQQPEASQSQQGVQDITLDEYRDQNKSAMESAIAPRAKDAMDSLQRLDQRLGVFEDRFVDAAVSRIDTMPLRIEQKLAKRLQERQESRQKPEINDILDAYVVPNFGLPAAAECKMLGAQQM